MKQYDVAAYIWPSYTGKEPRSRLFWEQGIGEWQSVLSAESRVDGQILPRTPLWGTVDEADPSVMEFQIKEALRHGVNVFIYDWHWYDRRPFLEQCLDDGFLGAPNNEDMRFYLMWANHDAGYLWDKRQSGLDEIIWFGSQPRSEFDRICRRVIDLYFKRPNYYKIDGCPVFMVYEMSNLVRGLGGVKQTREVLDYFRRLTEEAGFPGLHLQATIYSENAVNVSGVDSSCKGSTRDLVELLGFDSVTHYQFVQFVDCNRDYCKLLPDVQKEWDRIRAEYKTPYYPHVTVLRFYDPVPCEHVGLHFKEKVPQILYGIDVICLTVCNQISIELMIRNNTQLTVYVKTFRRSLAVVLLIKVAGIVVGMIFFPPAVMISVLISLFILIVDYFFLMKKNRKRES